MGETAMNVYIVTMKHDSGTTRIQVNASSYDAAVASVLRVESAPERAVRGVRRAF